MQRSGLFIIYFSTLTGCISRVPEKVADRPSHQTTVNYASLNENNIISSPCAIILLPDDRKTDSLKNLYGDDFYTMSDDNLYYISRAREFLDSLKIPVIDTLSAGSLRFKIPTTEIIDIQLDRFVFAILLFNGKDSPVAAEIADFEKSFHQYMNR